MRYVEILEILDKGRTAALWDRDIDLYFRKYLYCKKWTAVPPYTGGYDQQPKEWIDISEQIERCIDEVNKYERATNGNIRKSAKDQRAGSKANRKQA